MNYVSEALITHLGLQEWQLALLQRCINERIEVVVIAVGRTYTGIVVRANTKQIDMYENGGGSLRQIVAKYVTGIQVMGQFSPDGAVSSMLWEAGRQVEMGEHPPHGGLPRQFTDWRLTWNGQTPEQYVNGELAQALLERVMNDYYACDLSPPGPGGVDRGIEAMVYFLTALWVQDMGL